jgi:hypothetical protein
MSGVRASVLGTLTRSATGVCLFVDRSIRDGNAKRERGPQLEFREIVTCGERGVPRLRFGLP